MRKLAKSWLYLSKASRTIFAFFFCTGFISHAQIANYVANGGFEEYYNCNNLLQISQAKAWNAIDSVKLDYSFGYFNTCIGNVPKNSWAFQYPRTGNAYILGGFLADNGMPPIIRNYAKNRLKSTLQAGKTYCVKFYVNIANDSPYGIDGFGAFFGPANTDTISQCALILSYINPQVQNPNGNVITDTLGWTLVTGTFVANGSEKYMVIGNFKTNAATNSATILPNAPPQRYTDAIIDDVSCIDVDLPAYAGPDQYAINGSTVYLGRPMDVGINEACTWYQLPSPFPFANTAGVTVPVTQGTQTYVVKQDICGNIKYDTVVVHETFTGLAEMKMKADDFKISPVPAADFITLSFSIAGLEKEFTRAKILNSIGQLVQEIEITFTDKKALVNVSDLPPGVYFLTLLGEHKITKKFVVAR